MLFGLILKLKTKSIMQGPSITDDVNIRVEKPHIKEVREKQLANEAQMRKLIPIWRRNIPLVCLSDRERIYRLEDIIVSLEKRIVTLEFNQRPD
jgi:hypothetical protein